MWKDVLHGVKKLMGNASKWGIVYYASDPMDNPDYEKFCIDFSDILGMFPQTTTALAHKDIERMRSLLKLSRSRNCRLDRFSVLSLGLLKKIYRAFTPDELTHVEIISQMPESNQLKADAGRYFEKMKKKPELR